MFILGGLVRAGINARADGQNDKANAYGAGAAAMVFIFTAVFGATWLTVPWLYPAEIFPLAVRAKGNAWGVVGWSIGNGWLTLLCPVSCKTFLPLQSLTSSRTMFKSLVEKTFYIFGACNAFTIPMVWALYPESNQRTLEEMDLLFASDSIWNWDAEKNYRKLVEENPHLVQAAKRGQSVVDPETGLPKNVDHFERRRSSYAAVYGCEAGEAE